MALNIFTLVGILIILGNIFGKYYFFVDQNGVYGIAENTYFTSFIIPLVMFIMCAVKLGLLPKSLFEIKSQIFSCYLH